MLYVTVIDNTALPERHHRHLWENKLFLWNGNVSNVTYLLSVFSRYSFILRQIWISILELEISTLQVIKQANSYTSFRSKYPWNQNEAVFVAMDAWRVYKSTKAYVQKFCRGSRDRAVVARAHRVLCEWRLCADTSSDCMCEPASRCAVCWHIMYIWMNQIIREYEFYTWFLFLSSNLKKHSNYEIQTTFCKWTPIFTLTT